MWAAPALIPRGQAIYQGAEIAKSILPGNFWQTFGQISVGKKKKKNGNDIDSIAGDGWTTAVENSGSTKICVHTQSEWQMWYYTTTTTTTTMAGAYNREVK